MGTRKGIIFKSIYLILCVVCCIFIFNSSYSVFTAKTEWLDVTELYELKPGEILNQTIEDYSGALKNIYIRFHTYGRINDGHLTVSLLEDADVIEEWNIDASELTDTAYEKFTLPRYKIIKSGVKYTIQVREVYDGENSVAVYLSAGGNGLAYADGGSLENRTLCYQMESVGLKETHFFQALVILIMALAFGILALDKNLKPVQKIFFVISLTVLIEIVIVDLLEKINTDVRMESFREDGSMDELQPGESKYYDLVNKKCAFDALEVLLWGENKNGLYVSFSNADTGEVIKEVDVNDRNIIADPEIGVMAINAVYIRSEHRIEKGNYIIFVENRSEAPISLCTKGDGLNVVEIKYTKIGYYIALLLIAILIAYFGLIIFFTRRDGTVNPEKFFVITIVCIGLCHFLLLAPWNIPDSGAHVKAVYRLSNILLGFPEDQYWYGRTDDVQFLQDVWKNENPDMSVYAKVFYNFNAFCSNTEMVDFKKHNVNMEYYSLLCYWPQVLGLCAGRIAGFGTVACVYIARMMVFIFYIWGCLNAIKNTPVGKSLFSMIPLLPTPVMFSSSISYDPLVLITTLNFVAFILALYKDPTSKKLLFQAMLWTFLVGATKGGGYLILLPLVFILLDGSNLKKSWFTISAIVCSGVFSVLLFDKWLQTGKELFQLGSEGNGKMSASYALYHPVKYIQMSFTTYLDNADTYLFDTIGVDLGWLIPTIPYFIAAGLAVIIILYAIIDKDDTMLDTRVKYILGSIIVLIILITPAMLLSNTAKGSEIIVGIQGRYYLPALVLLMMLISKFSLHDMVSDTNENKILPVKNICIYIFSSLLCCSVYYMLRFYLRQ